MNVPLDFSENIDVLNDVIQFYLKYVYLHISEKLVHQEPEIKELNKLYEKINKDSNEIICCDELKWNTIILPGKKLMTFTENSQCRPNMIWKEENMRGMTVQNIVDSVYRINKYENTYCEIQLVAKQDGYIFKVKFDNNICL